MKSSKAQLLETLDRIKGLPVLVVGDIILDRYIWGRVERISPEAPVPVVQVSRVEDRLGGAGNAVRNLCTIGACVALCGVIGDDEEGKRVLDLLQADGVEREGVMIDRGRPTSLKTRVIAHSQQVVRIDREDCSIQGVALREGLAALVEEKLKNAKVIVLSDYGKGAINEPILKRLRGAREQGKIGLASRPLIVDPHPANYDLYSGITLAKPNRKEAELAADRSIRNREDALEVARLLQSRWDAEMMMVTLGEDGLVLLTPDHPEGVFLETVAQEVFDVSGAGDTVTAIIAAALGTGADPVVAGDLANIAAGIVVSEIGTVPIDRDRLIEVIKRMDDRSPGE